MLNHSRVEYVTAIWLPVVGRGECHNVMLSYKTLDLFAYRALRRSVSFEHSIVLCKVKYFGAKTCNIYPRTTNLLLYTYLCVILKYKNYVRPESC